MNLKYIILLLALCSMSFAQFEYLNVYSTEAGIGNMVKISFEAKGNATNVSTCHIDTHNIIDEDNTYWYKDFGGVANLVNITAVFDKNDLYRMYITCTDTNNQQIDSSYIILNGLRIISGWEVIVLLAISALLLIASYLQKNILYLSISAFMFFLYIKLSEGALLTELAEYAMIFTVIKIFFTVCLIALLFERIFKRAYSD